MNDGQFRAALNRCFDYPFLFFHPPHTPSTSPISSLSLSYTHMRAHMPTHAHAHTGLTAALTDLSPYLLTAAAFLHRGAGRKQRPGSLGLGQADLSNRNTMAILLRSKGPLYLPPPSAPTSLLPEGTMPSFKSDLDTVYMWLLLFWTLQSACCVFSLQGKDLHESM